MQTKFHKKLATFCTLVIVLATVFTPSTLVYGAPNDSSLSLYEDVTEISDKSIIRARGSYLNYGAVTMTKISSTRIRISGETAAYQVCDKLGIHLYLYRSSDGVNYENYRDWYFSKKDGSYFWKVLELIVPSGYYYAIAGGHTAIVGDDVEMTTTYAEGLWVN